MPTFDTKITKRESISSTFYGKLQKIHGKYHHKKRKGLLYYSYTIVFVFFPFEKRSQRDSKQGSQKRGGHNAID